MASPASQEQAAAPMRLPSPRQIDWNCAPVHPLDSYRVGFGKIVLGNKTSNSCSLFHFTVPTALPYQQVGNPSRIIQDPANSPGREHGNLLAINSKAQVSSVPASTDASTLFHHLIPVVALSREIPVRGCVFKESVKVCTPKSPAFSDDFSSDFASLYVFPHCSCAQTQHFCRLAERKKPLASRGRFGYCLLRHCGLPIGFQRSSNFR